MSSILSIFKKLTSFLQPPSLLQLDSGIFIDLSSEHNPRSALFPNKQFVLSLANFDTTTYPNPSLRTAFNITAGQLTVTGCVFTDRSVPSSGSIDTIFEVFNTKLYFNVSFSSKAYYINLPIRMCHLMVTLDQLIWLIFNHQKPARFLVIILEIFKIPPLLLTSLLALKPSQMSIFTISLSLQSYSILVSPPHSQTSFPRLGQHFL